MRTKNELYQEALRTVARRRQTARAKAEDARAEAEAAVPGLRHAEEEVRVRPSPMPAKSWPTCWPPAAVPPTHWSRTSPAGSAKTPALWTDAPAAASTR